jgi:hypothetical protein
LDETGEQPVALSYLQRLGVDVARQVKLVAVTHWHDDHIRGIAKVLDAAISAKFACSSALRHEEFFQLVAAAEEIKLVELSSGLAEFGEVLEILDQRSAGRTPAGPDHWACEDKLVYRTSDAVVEVHALSPSAQTITDSKRSLAAFLPRAGEMVRRIPNVSPNELSVVLLVKSADLALLLGADLERGNDERRGWRAIVASALRPRCPSAGYKVAHHGSENADLNEIWTELVDREGRAILTPYARGKKELPSEDDVERIKARIGHAYCTVWPPTRKPPKRGEADRTINEVATHRRAFRKQPGHIRLRVPIKGCAQDVTVETFDGAREL